MNAICNGSILHSVIYDDYLILSLFVLCILLIRIIVFISRVLSPLTQQHNYDCNTKDE